MTPRCKHDRAGKADFTVMCAGVAALAQQVHKRKQINGVLFSQYARFYEMNMRALLINKTDDLGHHGCTLVNRQIDQFAKEAGIDIVSKTPLHADWDRVAETDFDAVIVNGEGTLHSSSKGAKRIAEVPNWAAKYNKPAYLINSIYQNNDSQITREISKFNFIFVRDGRSANELAINNIRSSVVPDLSLTWETEPAQCAGRVIINGSTKKNVRQQLYKLSNKDKPYIPILAYPPEGSRRRRKYKFKRVLSLLAPPGVWRARNRYAIANFDDFAAYLLTQVSGVITGRFHMATIALCLEIPVVAIRSNSHKMEGLFEALELSDRIAQVNEASGRLRPYSGNELERIRTYRKRARIDARKCFSMIAGA